MFGRIYSGRLDRGHKVYVGCRKVHGGNET